jgi:hypothetical protein
MAGVAALARSQPASAWIRVGWSFWSTRYRPVGATLSGKAIGGGFAGLGVWTTLQVTGTPGVTVNCWVPPTATLAGLGATDSAGGATTFTVPAPDLDGSATLVATTWKTPVVPGAEYRPVGSIDPPPAYCTVQLTWVTEEPTTFAA